MRASRAPACRRLALLIGLALFAPTPAAASDAPQTAGRWGDLLAAGDADALVALYGRDGSHRDLATGELVRGRAALQRFFAGRLEGAGPAPRLSGFVPLGEDAALARMVLAGSTGSAWPPYTAVLLVREAGGWRIAATRAGGNPDALEAP